MLLVIRHPLSDSQARETFAALCDAASQRLGGMPVQDADLNTALDCAKKLQASGATKLLVLSWFLHLGAHAKHDIPALLQQMRGFGLEVTDLGNLERDPLLEDLMVERALDAVAFDAVPDRDGPAIERESHAIIDRRIRRLNLPEGQHQVLRRVIHATADFSWASRLRFHPDAITRGVAAIHAGAPIICDSTILAVGCTRAKGEKIVAINAPGVAEAAKAAGTTRAVIAMQQLAPQMNGAVIAIGNAPTALFEVIRLHREGKINPALVIGLPVGFVGSLESKIAVMESGLCWIANRGHRGGSTAAAAAVNALALLPSPV